MNPVAAVMPAPPVGGAQPVNVLLCALGQSSPALPDAAIDATLRSDGWYFFLGYVDNDHAAIVFGATPDMRDCSTTEVLALPYFYTNQGVQCFLIDGATARYFRAQAQSTGDVTLYWVCVGIDGSTPALNLTNLVNNAVLLLNDGVQLVNEVP